MKVYKIHHSIVIIGCFLEDIIIYFIGDWYLPFQNNSTIVPNYKGTQSGPFEYLTDLSRSYNKPVNERIHLITNVLIDDFCVVARHSCIGMAHHLTHNL